MKAKVGIVLTSILIVALLVTASLFYWKENNLQSQKNEKQISQINEEQRSQEKTNLLKEKELNQLREKLITELRADERLKVNMVPTLRMYRDMLKLLDNYAQKVETDIEILQQISNNEFQEDIILQAALFKGKKATQVAKHLEEFNAGRVGAILAKMKEQEASNVLDVWAEPENTQVSKFYRAVMAAYLQNKRRDANPEYYKHLSKKTKQLK